MSFLKQGAGFTKPAAIAAASVVNASNAPASGKNLLVVVEGEVTEKVYFDCVRRKLELGAAQFDIIPHGSNNPRDLVDRVLKEKAARLKQANNRKSLVAPIKFGVKKTENDENSLWIVFDTDAAAAQGHLVPGLAYAAEKKVRVASSTPSFEFWLALHLSNSAPYLRMAADAESHLNGLLHPHEKTYTKRQAESVAKALMPWFLETHGVPARSRVVDAIRHAGQVKTNRTAGANTACSDVHDLFGELLAAALPHHRAAFLPKSPIAARSRPAR